KGLKLCGSCSGKGKSPLELVRASVIVEPEAVDPVYSTDLSTPSSAAMTYADLTLRRLVEQNKMLWGQLKQARDLMATYFTKEAVRSTETVLSKSHRLSQEFFD